MELIYYQLEEPLIKPASWTLEHFGGYPKCLKWSLQSLPMTDLVRKSLPKTPDQPSLLLSLHNVTAHVLIRRPAGVPNILLDFTRHGYDTPLACLHNPAYLTHTTAIPVLSRFSFHVSVRIDSRCMFYGDGCF